MKFRTCAMLLLALTLVLALSLSAAAATREHKCQVYFGPQTEIYSSQTHGMIHSLALVWDNNGLKSLSFFLGIYGQGNLTIDDIYYVEGENDVKWRYSDRKKVPIVLSHTDPAKKKVLEEKLFIFGTGPINWENGRVVFKMQADGVPFEAYWNLKKNEIFSPMFPEEECPEAGAGTKTEVPNAEPSPPKTDYQ